MPPDPALPRHARHLTQTRDRIRHEVDDELGGGGVKCLVSERKLLRGGALHATPGLRSLAAATNDSRGVDRRHRGRTPAGGQLAP